MQHAARGPSLCLVLTLLVPLFAGCLAGSLGSDTTGPGADDPSVPDPLADGDRSFAVYEYDFGYSVVQGQLGEPYPVWMHGNLHLPDGDGPFPVVVFQHGRHGTCDYRSIGEFFSPFVCPDTPATQPVDSYTGYDYLARHLASHGYAVVSLDTNDINDQDLGAGTATGDAGGWARAQLVLDTLDAFALRNEAATAPRLPSLEGSALVGDDGIGEAVVGRLDLSRIGLMGHSRGGEGVAVVVEANGERTTPYPLKGVFSLAPIDARDTIVTDVPWATLLPYCDGDVFTLNGADIYDHSREVAGNTAPLVQVEVLGANHNWFNTVWTGDDNGNSGDPYCGGDGDGRFSYEDQQVVGLGIMAPFLRWTVGDESTFAPLFTKHAAFPDTVCPEVGCTDRVHVSYHAPAGDQLSIEDGRGNPVRSNDLGGPTQITGPEPLRSLQCRGSGCLAESTRGAAWQVAVEHDAGFTYATTFDAQDVGAYDVFTLRVLTTDRVSVNVTLTDAGAASTTVNVVDPAVFVPPGDADRAHVLNMVRLDLHAFDGIDLQTVSGVTIDVAASDGGVVQLTDLMFQRTP